MDIQDIVSLTALVRILLGITIVLLLTWWATRRRDADRRRARPRQGRRPS